MTGDRQRCDHRISLLNSSLLSQFVTSFIGIILYKKCDKVSKCLCFLCEMCATLNTRTLRFLVSSPGGRVCARFEPVVSNSCSTSGSSGEDTRDLSWVFKAGEEVYGERYWLIFMGAVGDGDFWLFDWRIAQEMRELKCVARCRRNVMGLHLWPTFRVDILKSFSKEYLI